MERVTAADERRVVDQAPTQLLVGGEWRDAAAGGRFTVEDPSTGEALAEVADGRPEDAVAALEAAANAQAAWAAHPPRERGEILRRAFEEMLRRADDLALLMTLEMGKPLREAMAEVAYAAEFFRWFSEEAVRIDGRYGMAADGRSRTLVLRQPVGPALLITPWNFPLAMGTRKIGPAIAAGCTTVIKPAHETPLSMLALAGLLEEVGVPPGVVNVVPTSSAGATTAPLFADRRLRKISFTGSTEVGRVLVGLASKNLLRCSMELGGNAPFLVFEDADLDAAVEGALVAKMRNLGESCVAANRFYVAEPVAADFAQRLAERMGRLTVGRGTDQEVDVGPLVNSEQQAKVAELVSDAVGKGAAYALEGGVLDGPGHFYRPAVLTDVPGDARLLREEIFGPVAPDLDVRRRGRGDRRGQRHGVRARRLRLHPRPDEGASRRRGARHRHGRAEPRHRLEPGGAVRRSQALRHRARGRPGGNRRVSRGEARGRRDRLVAIGPGDEAVQSCADVPGAVQPRPGSCCPNVRLWAVARVALERVARLLPVGYTTGVAPHASEAFSPEESVGVDAGNAVGVGAVDDDLVVSIERGDRILDGLEVERPGDVLAAVGEPGQGHDEFELVTPFQFPAEFLTADQVHGGALLVR